MITLNTAIAALFSITLSLPIGLPYNAAGNLIPASATTATAYATHPPQTLTISDKTVENTVDRDGYGATTQAEIDKKNAEEKAAKEAAEKKVAEEKAAKEAAEAKTYSSKKRSSSSAPAVGTPTPGSAKEYAKSKLASMGMGNDQFSCLSALWTRESGWNTFAHNSSSGAYGIPQSLPGNKMASAGSDWKTNPQTQINWGLSYIKNRYGTPCKAWAHSEAVNWY